MDGRLWSRVAYSGRRPGWMREERRRIGLEGTEEVETGEGKIGQKGVWVDSRDLISGPGGKGRKGGGFDIPIPGGGAGEISDVGRLD